MGIQPLLILVKGKIYLSAILLLKMSEIKDLVQRITDEQNANLKENEIELIQGEIESIYETAIDSMELIKGEHEAEKQAKAKKIEILKEKYHRIKETNTRHLEELTLP